MKPGQDPVRRGKRASSIVLASLVALTVVGCADRPAPSSPAPLPTSSLALATQSPSTTAAPIPASTPRPTPGARCQTFAFDATAPLGPEFEKDIFEHGEAEQITGQFIAGLGQFYANPDAIDPCQWFTREGLRTAVSTDPTLRSVARGDLRIEGDLSLRLAAEGIYDLRRRPPLLPIDAIFDIAAGARTTDIPTGTTTTSATDERVALHLDFKFDGHRWRADQVGPISDDNAQFTSLPAPIPPGEPCSGFRRDPGGAAFDDDAGVARDDPALNPGRTWCDADGHGRVINQPQQVGLLTKYCGAVHAAVLTIGRPLGMPLDPLVPYEYVRDPAGEPLAQGWVTAPYQAKAALPEDAAYTGWTNGNIELWVSPSAFDRAIYVKRGVVIERWPRAAKTWGVIDCN
jgi:hypothetical protein